MPQVSLTAWLKKPAVSKQPSTAPGNNDDASLSAEAKSQLATSAHSQDIREDSKPTLALKALHATEPAALSGLPPQVDLRRCNQEDLPHFKRLNSLLLPIPYPESFYREIVEDPLTNNITLLATWHDDPARKGQEKGRLIGAVRGRLFAHPPTPQHVRANTSQVIDGPMLYLSTLVLLSPYRHYGIATRMLDVLLKRAVEDYGITTVGAHVWEANTEGLEWYRKRNFQEVRREAEYYRRLQPAGAVVMQRDVKVVDLLGK